MRQCKAVRIFESLAESLDNGKNRLLEMIARGSPTVDVLENLLKTIEEQADQTLCSILLLNEDGVHVSHGAPAPSLPVEYSRAIDGSPIGPKAGSCGTAMYRREQVIVTDIMKDPLWEDYRPLADKFGLRACWSTPIFSHRNEVLGSFAMYYKEVRSPTSAESALIDLATHIAGIAIEREKAERLANAMRAEKEEAQTKLVAQEKLATIGSMAASIVHDFRNPLSIIRGYAWLAADDTLSGDERVEILRTVRHEADRLGALAQDILDYTRGSIQTEKVPVDIKDFLRQAEQSIRPYFHESGATFEIHGDCDGSISLDRDRFLRVLINIAGNAADVLNKKGRFDLQVKRTGDRVLFTMTDNGPGIPDAIRPNLFEAFVTHGKSHGTGLGMAIAKSIVEAHGGTIRFESESGNGTTFFVEIPA